MISCENEVFSQILLKEKSFYLNLWTVTDCSLLCRHKRLQTLGGFSVLSINLMVLHKTCELITTPMRRRNPRRCFSFSFFLRLQEKELGRMQTSSCMVEGPPSFLQDALCKRDLHPVVSKDNKCCFIFLNNVASESSLRFCTFIFFPCS